MKRYKFLACLAVCMTVLSFATLATARMSPRQIYKTKADGVVLIVASEEGASSASAGTGSIIEADGTIITNCHVIYDQEAKKPYPAINVFLKPARVTGDMNKDLARHFTAKLVAFDKDLDLALLKLTNPPRNLTVLSLGDPDQLGPGDETIAIGHPEQGGLWTITTGVIGTQFENFKGITGKNVFQMETSLNRGNSGGPLFDVRGYQIGVNTAIARQGQGGVAITGVNFALKASVVRKFAAGHSVALAYGLESLNAEDTRVAVAAAPKDTSRAKQPPTTVPTPPPPESVEKSSGKTVYGSKATGGTITVDDQQGEEVAPRRSVEDNSTEAGRTYKQTPRRKPLRFKKHYRIRPRPYTFKRLLTAVDKVRGRADAAFDDLDNEVERRHRSH
ncbi:MAG TPA: trypsin-like peptidase domain-containing protein [Myxococcota bacterium]|nr:trypsin-like peptidase domain-containing protein [Myxococcota bacterium]